MGREKIIIVLSVIIGLVAAGTIYVYTDLAKKTKSKPAKVLQKPEVKTVEVVAAAKDVSRNTRLEKNLLKLVKVPADSVHPKAMHELKDAVGKIAHDRLFKDQIILSQMLHKEKARPESPPVEAEQLSGVVPVGMRAITIMAAVDKGVGNMLRPRDHVDVIVFMSKKKAGRDVSFTMLRNVEILALDATYQEKETSALVKKVTGGMNKLKEYKSVTLVASPEECMKLNLAESVGEIKLVLHAHTEPETEENMRELEKKLERVDIMALAKDAGIPVAKCMAPDGEEPKKEQAGAGVAPDEVDRKIQAALAKLQSNKPAPAAPRNTVLIMRGSELAGPEDEPAPAAGQPVKMVFEKELTNGTQDND